MIGAINMQKYVPQHQLSDNLIENLEWLRRREFMDKVDANILLDLIDKDGKEILNKRMSLRPWSIEELLNMPEKYVLTSEGNIFRVLNVLRVAGHSDHVVMLLDQSPVVAYVFSNSGRCDDLSILTYYESDPTMERSTSLPKSMAAPYGNDQLKPQLTSFDEPDDSDKTCAM